MRRKELLSQFQQLVRGENARNMSRESLVSTFVETPQFQELFTAQNNIIIGARGSGKTALAKMLSHDHLSALAARGSSLAQRVINEKSYIGLYLSTKTEWVGSLKNKPWSNKEEKEQYFSWRLNVAACKALLDTLRSCLRQYVSQLEDRIRLERKVIRSLSDAWLTDTAPDVRSITEMRELLEDYEYFRELQYTRKRLLRTDVEPVALAFEAQLFAPLKYGITLIKRLFKNGLEDSTWFLCIDEAEFLNEDHHRILNSHLRADSEDLSFKITTTPYRHHTKETNLGAPVRNGHDFEYVYISRKRTPQHEEEFARELFGQLTFVLGSDIGDVTLERLLGESDLLESKPSQWSLDSREMQLLKKHATPRFYRRAVSYLENGEEEKFRSAVVRKVHGLLKLREAVKAASGAKKLDVYSGWKMLARCGEDNPRRILRLLKRMISVLGSQETPSEGPLIPTAKQNEIFVQFSARELERTKTEPNCREKLHELLRKLGGYASSYFLERDFTGDVVSAFEIKPNDPEEYWDLTTRAVEWGLLYPKVNKSNPDDLPRREGQFHIANVLAPQFNLLPRRGRAHRLTTIMQSSPRSQGRGGQQLEFDI